MTIEARLEALERSINILNTTVKELIDLYLDTQINPLLGDLPKTAGFEPKVIKDRKARKRKATGVDYSFQELRKLLEQVYDSKGEEFTSSILGRYNIRSLAELPITEFNNFATELLEALNGSDKTIV